MAVTEIPWPIGIDPIAVPDQLSGSSRIPGSSCGKPRAVGWPNPKRRRYSSSRGIPSRWAISIVPMLEDRDRIWLAVISGGREGALVYTGWARYGAGGVWYI